jgi:hypothetical protein
LLHRGGGGEHEDPGLGTGFDQRAAHIIPGHDRQVAVEDDDVVVVDRQPLERGITVVGDVDGHRVAAQAHRDRVGKQPFVFHHQNAHLPIMPGPGVRALLGIP